MFRCTKFSYTKGNAGSRTVSLDEDVLTYSKSRSVFNQVVPLRHVRGVVYGPRTTVFSLVKSCTPWLVLSFITSDRTYDFEFRTMGELTECLDILRYYKTHHDARIVVPSGDHIGIDRAWMETNVQGVRSFKRPDWRRWISMRSCKHKEVVAVGDACAEGDQSQTCCICQDHYADGDIICELPCSHIYHSSCIATWLNRSRTCPVCRSSL